MADTAQAGDVVPATTREELLVQHAEARRRRNSAPLGSHAWEEASHEVGRIEREPVRRSLRGVSTRGFVRWAPAV